MTKKDFKYKNEIIFVPMNEILLYGPIWQESSVDFINAINEIEQGEGLRVRINSGGGDVMYGWGCIAKYKEFTGEKLVSVDGQAMSMAFFFLCYADNSESLDVSRFLIHRAAYSKWYEDEYMTETDKASLTAMNADLERAFRNKVDVAKFEQITGVKVKDIFSMDSRIDVEINAKQAKQIGLISKINTITPTKSAEINASMQRIAANYGMSFQQLDAQSGNEKPVNAGNENNENANFKINNKMTIEQLRAEHPELVAQISASAVKNERDRVGAWMKFMSVDAEAVTAGIDSGNEVSQTVMAEMMVKMGTQNTLNGVQATTEGIKVETEKVDDLNDEKPNKVDAYKSSVMDLLNLKK